jgi:hypothetical protein
LLAKSRIAIAFPLLAASRIAIAFALLAASRIAIAFPLLCASGAAVLVSMLATSAGALPLLSEVYYDAPGSDDMQLFVEIAGLPGTSLDGYFVEGINGSNGAAGPTLELTGAIDASGLFVIADQASDGSTSVLGADLLANFDFQNGPDSIVLREGDLVVDAIGYGVFGETEIFAGEGQAAPDVAPGESLARRFADVDTDDNASDFQVLAVPTPGAADFAVVPEPGTAMLLGLGLSGLALAGGRQSRALRSTLSPANHESEGEENVEEGRLVLLPQGLNELHPSVQVPGRPQGRDQRDGPGEPEARRDGGSRDCEGLLEGDRCQGQEARQLRHEGCEAC